MARRTVYRERKRLNAALLAFIGGGLGLHKFYLRDTGGGIFYLILAFVTINSFYFPFSVILGLFDAMKLLMMPDSEFDRKYNRQLLKQNRSYRKNSRSKVHQKPSKRVRNNPFKKTALAKYKDFALEESIEDFKKAIEIDNGDPDLHFNIACAYSLTEQADEAFYHLSKAVENGFADFEKIKTHDDLAFVRIQPGFEQFQKNNYSNYTGVGKRNNQTQTSANNQVGDDLLLAQLNKLKELRDKGILNENDYVTETKKLMRRR